MSGHSTHRSKRMASRVHELIGEAVSSRIKDPRVGFATVTEVRVSPDNSVAWVRVSIMGSDDRKREAMEGLEHAKGFLRSILAKELHARTVPELRFELDRNPEHATRIEELLDQVKEEDSR